MKVWTGSSEPVWPAVFPQMHSVAGGWRLTSIQRWRASSSKPGSTKETPLGAIGTASANSSRTSFRGRPRSTDNTAVVGHFSFATVYERSEGGPWKEVTLLVPSDATEGRFGASVALWDDTALVGAPGHDEAGTDAGAVYVFERDEDGAWGEPLRLIPPGLEAWDDFGRSVALEGVTAVVGSPGDDDLGPESGAVYVLEPGSLWKLVAADGGPFEEFGLDVAISGDRVMVSGGDSLYLFERNAGGVNAWGLVAKFDSSDLSPVHAVDLDGATAVAGSAGLSMFFYELPGFE